MRKAVLGLVLLAVPAAAEVRTGTFRSEAVGREVRYVADLPASYATSDSRYPVVYALHGLFEDASFWERRGLAADLAAERSAGRVRDFIVIAVDGGNSFFVNQAGGAYQDLVTRDLVAHVDATFRTIPQRDARGLWGVSMGGYAALRIALAEPGRFAAVATHSAMLLTKPPDVRRRARAATRCRRSRACSAIPSTRRCGPRTTRWRSRRRRTRRRCPRCASTAGSRTATASPRASASWSAA